MIHRLYAIYDRKTGLYGLPFKQHNDAVAQRTIQSLTTDEQSDFSKHPQDFQMEFVGTFDDETGIVINCDAKENEKPKFNIRFDQLKKLEAA